MQSVSTTVITRRYLSTGDPERDAKLSRGIYEGVIVMIGYGWDYLMHDYRHADWWPDLLDGLLLYGYSEEVQLLREARDILVRHDMQREDMDDPRIDQVGDIDLADDEARRMQEIERTVTLLLSRLFTEIDLPVSRPQPLT
jgi:hypothetical protein